MLSGLWQILFKREQHRSGLKLLHSDSRTSDVYLPKDYHNGLSGNEEVPVANQDALAYCDMNNMEVASTLYGPELVLLTHSTEFV